MSSGTLIYNFTACKFINVFIPSESQLQQFAVCCLQHHGSSALSSCALCLSFPFSSYEPSLCMHLFTGRLMESIPQVLGNVYISCEVARHLPPHTECGQRARLSGTASHPMSSQQQCCQRWGHRKYYILLRNLFLTAASPGQGANKRIFGALTVLVLANLSDHVWFAACMSL